MGTKHSRAKATALAAMVPLGMRRIRGKKDEIPEKTWEIPGKAMQNCDWTMKNRIYGNHGLTIQNGDSITTKRYQKRFCWFSHPIKNMVLYNHQRRGNIVVESQFTIWIYLDELYELNSLKIAIIIRPWRGMVPIPNHLSYKVGPPEIAMLVNISKSSLGLC